MSWLADGRETDQVGEGVGDGGEHEQRDVEHVQALPPRKRDRGSGHELFDRRLRASASLYMIGRVVWYAREVQMVPGLPHVSGTARWALPPTYLCGRGDGHVGHGEGHGLQQQHGQRAEQLGQVVGQDPHARLLLPQVHDVVQPQRAQRHAVGQHRVAQLQLHKAGRGSHPRRPSASREERSEKSIPVHRRVVNQSQEAAGGEGVHAGLS